MYVEARGRACTSSSNGVCLWRLEAAQSLWQSRAQLLPLVGQCSTIGDTSCMESDVIQS